MKVLHINSSDSSGGAARACLDLNSALNKAGIESRVLVQSKYSGLTEVYSVNTGLVEKIKTLIRRTLDFLFIKIFTVEKRGRFTFPFLGTDISKLQEVKDADLINLHWINEGFLSLRSLTKVAGLAKPIVWTMHDKWAFTGGCHYSMECRKFEKECFDCPSLKIKSRKDLSNRIFFDKVKLFKDLNFDVVTCSNWLSEEVKKSQLLKDKNIKIIPNTLKTEIYKPLNKAEVFKKLDLDKNKKYILFGTMTLKDQRKGIDLFLECIDLLCKSNSFSTGDKQLLIAGSEKNMGKISLPIAIRFLGRLNNEEDLAKFYNAGSLFIAPSREDNLPNTVMESLSCGTPVAAFNIGGMPDMIDHKINGYLAKPFDIKDLAEGIIWILNHPNPQQLADASRSKVLKNFTYQKVAESYSEYYKTIINKL